MEPIEMRKHRLPLDSSTIDRLLDGRIDEHDAPPGYAALARLLSDLATPPPAQEIDAELLDGMVRAIDSSPTPIDRKTSMISKLLTAKVGVIAAGIVVSTTGAAAAASGRLPAPAQDAISKAVSHVGVEIPTTDDGPTTDDRPTADDRPTTEERRTPEHRPTGNIDNGTDADQHGADVSDVARNTDLTGRQKGAAVSDAAKAGHGSSTTTTTAPLAGTGRARPADPGSQAPVLAPNPGGTGTASDASGGRSDIGTSRAPGQAGAGSGNAADHPTGADNPGTARRP